MDMFRIIDTITGVEYPAEGIDGVAVVLTHIFAGGPVSHRETIARTIARVRVAMERGEDRNPVVGGTYASDLAYLAVRIERIGG